MLPAPGSSPPPLLETLATAKALEQQRPAAAAVPSPSPSGDGISPSLLVVAAVIVFVFVVSASIHLLLRFLSRQSSSSSGASLPLALLRHSSSPSSSPPARRDGGREDEHGDLIDSLPLFTLASAVAALPKSSPDCAVCLSSFHPHDQLRLLPSCSHAFHSTCIDTWLRSSLSCPLCRSPIAKAPPPPPPPAQPRAPLAMTTAASTTSAPGSDRSGSFRLEIGSVSRRRTQEVDAPEPPPPHARSYSLGSSFQYVVEEEVEAVVSAVAAHVRQQRRKDDHKDPSDAAPAPPGEDVAEAAGGNGSRSWLMDYVDRLASSASSSFSSLRFSRCGSRRIDGGGGGWSWDLEGARPRLGEDDDDGTAALYSVYRWLTGV